MHIKNKAASVWRLAFSLLLLIILAACEDPSSIGGDYVKKTGVKVDTLLLDNLVLSSADPYLGRLSRSAVGNFEDDLFGSISAFSFLKVPIQSTVPDSLILSDTSTTIELELRMYTSAVYGDTSTTSGFSIYRVNEQWRGSTYRQSNALTYNDTELIGSFSEDDLDSLGVVRVPLTGSWKQEYINYFNSTAEDRVDIYRQNEFGLAIVADAGAQKINYFNLVGSDLKISDSEEINLDVSDWGYDFERTPVAPAPDKDILSSNLEQYYTFNLQTYADSLPSQNIAKAEMIFTQDSSAIDNSINTNELRTNGRELGINIGPSDDVAYELGFDPVDITGSLSGNEFTFDVTAAFNNYFYSGADITEIYIHLVSTQGLLTYTQLFSIAADPDKAPKLVVFSLVEEE